MEQKRKEEEELFHREKQLEEEKAQRERQEYIKNQTTLWLKEGYNESQTAIIVNHLVRTRDLLTHHNVITEFCEQLPPDPFKAVVEIENHQHVMIDLRCLFQNREFDLSRSHNIPGTDLYISLQEWKMLEPVWQVVNPFRDVSYLSSNLDLRVEETRELPQGSRQTVVDRMICTKYQPSPIMDIISLRYAMGWAHGANSVALPFSVVNPILNHMVDNNVLTDAMPVLVAEISSHNPLQPERVYAYCKNPDVHSKVGTIEMSFRLRAQLKVRKGEKVRIRLLQPSQPPLPPIPTVKLSPVVDVPESVADSKTLRSALIESFNFQQIVYPGQVIFAYVPDSISFGPIPFIICQTYDSRGRPVSVVSVHGHGKGIECAIETVSNPEILSNSGREAVLNYYDNLQQRVNFKTYPTLKVPKPTPQQIVSCIKKDLFKNRIN